MQILFGIHSGNVNEIDVLGFSRNVGVVRITDVLLEQLPGAGTVQVNRSATFCETPEHDCRLAVTFVLPPRGTEDGLSVNHA